MTQSVTARTIAHGTGADGLPGVDPVALYYTPLDPYAVQLTFLNQIHEGKPITWLFARDLLVDGINGGDGWGDVHVSATRKHVYISLTSGDGRAVLELDRKWVELFLRRAFRLVSRGDESVDVDRALAKLGVA